MSKAYDRALPPVHATQTAFWSEPSLLRMVSPRSKLRADSSTMLLLCFGATSWLIQHGRVLEAHREHRCSIFYVFQPVLQPCASSKHHDLISFALYPVFRFRIHLHSSSAVTLFLSSISSQFWSMPR